MHEEGATIHDWLENQVATEGAFNGRPRGSLSSWVRSSSCGLVANALINEILFADAKDFGKFRVAGRASSDEPADEVFGNKGVAPLVLDLNGDTLAVSKPRKTLPEEQAVAAQDSRDQPWRLFHGGQAIGEPWSLCRKGFPYRPQSTISCSWSPRLEELDLAYRQLDHQWFLG